MLMKKHLGNYEKKGKETMRDNDGEQKENLNIEDNKRKKLSVINLNVVEKEHLRKYKKKGKRVMRNNLDDGKIDYLNRQLKKAL